MKQFTKDKYGYLVQQNPDGSFDGGDSVNWNSHYCYLTEIDVFGILAFNVAPGIWVRHFDPALSQDGWASYWELSGDGVISRDQLTGILAICSKLPKSILRPLLRNHARRCLLFAFNVIANGKDAKTAKRKWPDFTGPQIWAMYIRSFDAWTLYPLLLLFDTPLLLSAIFRRFSKNEDVISHLIRLILAKDKMPTPVSFLARMIHDEADIKKKLIRYWGSWRKQGGMIDLYMLKLFS